MTGPMKPALPATDAAVPTAAAATIAKERDWQYRRLPKHLRPAGFPTGVK